MKIIVCVKQIGYIYDPTAINLATGEIDPEKMVSMLNPYDEIAVEEAIKIKESENDCEVIAITAGGPEGDNALKYSFAMGADRMIRLDYENTDPSLISLFLAKAIEKIGYDMVLCGKKSMDSNGGQVGSFLAERLHIPQVSGIVSLKLSLNDKKAVVERYLGKGDREELECDLPALFTTEMGLNDPRYPALPGRLLADKTNIEILDINSLGDSSDKAVGLTDILKFSQPRPKTRKTFSPDSNLSATDRLKLMMSGGGAKPKEDSNVLEGSADELSGHILKYLIQEQII
ncbi:MAG: electron transfer flavoprotein subunit beta/FixA family protein [Proteobacteria bacterium]|nr:electron transfer flavoprotein subunit beta/FixA family protein [Pseudomonadota bacterium]